MPQLPQDFREFLRLLNSHQVEYLLIGGYAVGYHGYPRTTADMDIWVAIHPENAQRLVDVLREFGFEIPELSPSLFLRANQVIRMGVPPMRIELLTSISGVEFATCYASRVVDTVNEVEISVISLDQLRANKRASGRHKDLADLEHLGE